MLDVDTAIERHSVPHAETSIPPRPQWLPKRPRPATARPLDNRETPSVADLLTKQSSRSWRQDTTPFLVSLLLHLMVLLVIWQMFRFVMRPEPVGYVITTEFDTGDGAETDLLTMVDSPIPKVQPVDQKAAAVDVTRVHVGKGPTSGEQATVGGGGEVGFFGAKASANSVLFVVDKSGSMAGQGRIEAAKQELVNALQQLQPSQRFYVIFYSSHMHRMLDPAPPEQLLPATRRNVGRVLAWINRDVHAGGDTQPLDSLLTALKMQPEVIFFLTDGDVNPAAAATVHLSNAHGSVIHTLCLSEDYGEQVMRRIAKENKGRYRFVETDGFAPATSPTQKTRDEKIAAAKLKTAEHHLREGRPRTGQRWLERIIKDHPNTPTARQAQQRLESIRLTQ